MTYISNITAEEPITFYASEAGGRLAFNITTDVVTINGSGEQPLALLENPGGSGKDMYIDTGEFASSVNTQFRRYRGAAIDTRGTAKSGANMSGGAAASVVKMYPAGQFTITNTGTVAKTAHIASYEQYVTSIKGKTVLRPGNALYWTIDQPAGGTQLTASIYIEYYELPIGGA
jgi:hypothetical protein